MGTSFDAGDNGSFVDFYVNNPPAQPKWQPWLSFPFPWGIVPGVGPILAVAPPSTWPCIVADAGAASAAWGAAQYIQANASRYSANVVSAANQVISRYQGTGMGVAAGVAFLGALAATMTVGDFLLLLAGIGASAVLIYEAIKCHQGVL
jgi:hypothetical protein